METSLNWKPNRKHPPCKLDGQECSNKHLDYGRCRNTCTSYAEYQTLNDMRKNAKNGVLSEYKIESKTREYRRSK